MSQNVFVSKGTGTGWSIQESGDWDDLNTNYPPNDYNGQVALVLTKKTNVVGYVTKQRGLYHSISGVWDRLNVKVQFTDDSLEFRDDVDTSKIWKLQIGNIDPSTIRTLTAPNRDLDLATPIFDTTRIGTIDGIANLSVDGSAEIEGHTTTILTGSINPTASVNVVGVGTLFLLELNVGDRITVSGETRIVVAIADNTHLTVHKAFSDNANDISPDKLWAQVIVKNSSGNLNFVVGDYGRVSIGDTTLMTSEEMLYVKAPSNTALFKFNNTMDGDILSMRGRGGLTYNSYSDNFFGTGSFLINDLSEFNAFGQFTIDVSGAVVANYDVDVRYITDSATWTHGVCGSDDHYLISKNAGFGVNDFLEIDTTGNVIFNGDGASALEIFADNTGVNADSRFRIKNDDGDYSFGVRNTGAFKISNNLTGTRIIEFHQGMAWELLRTGTGDVWFNDAFDDANIHINKFTVPAVTGKAFTTAADGVVTFVGFTHKLHESDLITTSNSDDTTELPNASYIVTINSSTSFSVQGVQGDESGGTADWSEDQDTAYDYDAGLDTHTWSGDSFAFLKGEVSINNNFIVPKTSGIGIKVDTTTPTFGFADLKGDQFSRNTGATKPTLAVHNSPVRAWQFSNGNEAYLSYHFDHDYVPGTDIFIHVHWSQNSTTATGGTLDFKYFAEYAKAHNQVSGSTFTMTPITATFSSIDINDGGSGLNQRQQHLTEVIISGASATAALFDRDDFEPDGVIELTFEMDANNLTNSGSVLDPFIHFVDIHYQTTGLIGTKAKAPPFNI